MQYALLNRFQATLVGAAIGELLGVQCQQRAQMRSIVSSQLFIHSRDLLRLDLQSLTQGCLENLLKESRLSKETYSAALTAIATPLEATIALLPLMLFFHEDRLKLKKSLQVVLQPRDLPEVFAVGLIISEILQEKLDPLTVIPELLTALKAYAEIDSLTQQLQQVQQLLQQQAGLEKALKHLLENRSENKAISVALYCFLSTPENFQLSILRAARIGYHSAIVCGLAGALSGAYNGLAGLAIEMRLAADQWRLPSGEVVTQHQLLQQASHLLAQWSGVYNPLVSDSLTSAIAAPQVIRKFG